MGIIHIQPQKYKCSKCGSTGGREYSRSAKPERPGTYEGVICPDCGHKTQYYKPSILEQEMGTGTGWSRNPNDPKPF